MDSQLSEKVRAFLLGLAVAFEVSWIADALRRHDYGSLAAAGIAAIATLLIAVVLNNASKRRHPDLLLTRR